MSRTIRVALLYSMVAILLAAGGCAGVGDDGAGATEGDVTSSADVFSSNGVDNLDAPDWTAPSDAVLPRTSDSENPDDAMRPNDALVPDGELTPDQGTQVDPPQQLDPCSVGKCWSSLSFLGACGPATLDENFSSGKYNVHVFSLFAKADVEIEITLQRTAGVWNPALLLHDAQGLTLSDGELGSTSGAIVVEVPESGRGGALARLKLRASSDLTLKLSLTSWQVLDSGFVATMPTDATYTFGAVKDCELPTGQLLSPPNFDPQNVVGGYYLLPASDPAGLYTKKKDLCSRGNKLLIDVLYTVANNWKQLYPELAPIAILDLNECDGANHETHDDGTHVDIVVECATDVTCADIQPAIDLAKLFIDTGQTCGIIFSDEAVQAVINPYFESLFDYTPWHGTFMRSYTGHNGHFHVRVKKPDGSCN